MNAHARRCVLALVLLQGVVTPGGGVSSGDLNKEDYQRQQVTPTPHTLERACTTRLGICRVANQTPPGQPCSCVAGNGARLDGYVISWRWTGVPTDLK
jgi:hypothetical protein